MCVHPSLHFQRQSHICLSAAVILYLCILHPSLEIMIETWWFYSQFPKWLVHNSFGDRHQFIHCHQVQLHTLTHTHTHTYIFHVTHPSILIYKWWFPCLWPQRKLLDIQASNKTVRFKFLLASISLLLTAGDSPAFVICVPNTIFLKCVLSLWFGGSFQMGSHCLGPQCHTAFSSHLFSLSLYILPKQH